MGMASQRPGSGPGAVYVVDDVLAAHEQADHSRQIRQSSHIMEYCGWKPQHFRTEIFSTVR
jgi:hypothetical protein